MSIKSKLEKLEKVIGVNNETAKSFFEKYGTLMPIVYLNDDMSEEEKAQKIEQKKTEYYQNIADGRNVKIAQAEEFHKEICKKNGINGEPMIIDFVS